MTVIETLRTARDNAVRAEAIAHQMGMPTLARALRESAAAADRAVASRADLLSVLGGRGA